MTVIEEGSDEHTGKSDHRVVSKAYTGRLETKEAAGLDRRGGTRGWLLIRRG